MTNPETQIFIISLLIFNRKQVNLAMKVFSYSNFFKLLSFIMCLLFVVYSTGCDEGDTSRNLSSSKIGLFGYSEDEQLKVEFSHKECHVKSTISIAVTCRNSGGALLKDIEVLFSSDNGGTFSDEKPKTNDFGVAGTNFTPTKEGTNLISINANGISKQITLQVYPSPIETYYVGIILSDDKVDINKTITVTCYVFDSSNNGVKDTDVSLICQFGKLADTTGKTDEKGFFSTTYTAPEEVGVDSISISALGEKSTIKISVQ